ncbi:sensor histidine kinase [Filifactor alocis]|uniref:sensor histidine kinase n=1 Tax=Filifactor alocis TaxID=143361 RepID=UPI0028EABBBE|nr:sensor histidine kinase [Filifactor alocis]
MNETLTIRPYARLITMLGDQLIKNELIALVELIKNSYDADASWVKVSFIDFASDYSLTATSKIIIEDDGCGMNADILKKHWLNPATPDKLRRKAVNAKTEKGRILQGEKGIGRFAIFKLGKTIKITTRRQRQDDEGHFIDEGDGVENTLVYDFSKYDDNFLKENGQDKDLFLENIQVEFSQAPPTTIVSKDIILGTTKRKRKPYGTIIEISNLKTKWTDLRVARVQKEVGKLQPIFSQDTYGDFGVWIYKDNQLHESQDRYKEQLQNCLENKSVFKVTHGRYSSTDNIISFKINGQDVRLGFKDSDISGLKQFEKFNTPEYKTECGSFRFEFYIFDFNVDSENPSKYFLDSDDKKIIREHRIYLYRDGLRVMPYGDPEDDWLRIDIARGTIRADEFLSNDQVVGCVYISQEENPKLIDKTNREGLIEDGRALDDFITVLQLILKYLRKKPFAQYLIDKQRKKEIDRIKRGRPSELIETAKKQYADDQKTLAFLKSFERSYKKEKKVLEDRINKTENLAAVGLSIETASHDVMLFIRKTLENQDSLIRDLMTGEEIDKQELLKRLTLIRGNLSIVETQMKDVQLLFPSTKSRTKNINVEEIINKVTGLYKRVFNDNKIFVDFDVTERPLIVKTTDAVLLQVFINLFDNSLYWLKTVDRERRIKISIDGNKQRLIFSDNGPGIKDDDINYVFEAFYSGKGEEGRGLGLYIAKQLLDRYDYSIDLAEFSKDKVLCGANFILEFIKEG